MGTPTNNSPSDEQCRIIGLSAKTCSIVQAGAGTGKTYTLIERVRFLVDEEGLDGSDELLILSFSRAATAEVRQRLRSGKRGLPYITVHTFDAYATFLLGLVEEDDEWTGLGYDDRIKRATHLIADTPGELDEITQLEHVLIDEAQDLVGQRADFALELLNASGAGFTIFTDEAQAIYGFSREHDDSMAPVPFTTRLDSLELPARINRLELTRQYRADSGETRRIMEFGARMVKVGSASQAGVRTGIIQIMDDLPRTDDLDTVQMLLRPRDGETSAILCRSNAQAVRASTELDRMHIIHDLRQRAGTVGVGPWLANLAATVGGHTVSIDEAEQLLDTVGDLPAPAPGTILTELRRIAGTRGREIDLRRVASRVRTGNVPIAFEEPNRSGVVVSTIHRAKGLEYDCVILASASGQSIGDDEDARVLYVGLSRAREEVWILDDYDTPDTYMDKRTGRVVRFRWGPGRRRRTIGLEALPGDVAPVLAILTEDRTIDVDRFQTYLRDAVASGDPVTLHRTHGRNSGDAAAAYRIIHDGTVIGSTSENFATAVSIASPKQSGQERATLEGARVDTIRTVVGDPTVAKRLGMSPTGLHLAVGLRGILDISGSGTDK